MEERAEAEGVSDSADHNHMGRRTYLCVSTDEPSPVPATDITLRSMHRSYTLRLENPVLRSLVRGRVSGLLEHGTMLLHAPPLTPQFATGSFPGIVQGEHVCGWKMTERWPAGRFATAQWRLVAGLRRFVTKRWPYQSLALTDLYVRGSCLQERASA